jgi:hypothetical protein
MRLLDAVKQIVSGGVEHPAPVSLDDDPNVQESRAIVETMESRAREQTVRTDRTAAELRNVRKGFLSELAGTNPETYDRMVWREYRGR